MKIIFRDDGNSAMCVVFGMFYDTDDKTMDFDVCHNSYVSFKVTDYEYRNYFNSMESDGFLDLSHLEVFEFESYN